MVTSDLGACEWFVWDLQRSGLIDRGQLDQVVGEFLKHNPRAEPYALAQYLISQDILSEYQADRILNGKTQGLVLGPYVLIDSIGAGSMGQVYQSMSRTDNQFYAVKVLPRRSMWNVRLARRQVRSFTSFNHPAVVPFTDVGTSGGLHYLVWPLVEGETLESLVQTQGQLTPEQTALVGLQIAQGLNICHQHGLFHGLLKPSNVMVGHDQQARILDFGIGSLLVENEGESLVDTMSSSNSLTSGLDCCAPESIIEPTNRTPAGDQYSLGCTLYFCLAGRFPFPEGSAVEKMMAHQSKQPEDLRQLCPDAPESLIAIIERLMHKATDGRFTGADEVVELLEPLAGHATMAQPSAKPAATRQLSGGMEGSRLAQYATPSHAIPNHATPANGMSPRRSMADFEAPALPAQAPMPGQAPGRMTPGGGYTPGAMQPGISSQAAMAPPNMPAQAVPTGRPMAHGSMHAPVPPIPDVHSSHANTPYAPQWDVHQGPGGWVPEDRGPRLQLGQTGLLIGTIALVGLAYFAASMFLF